MLLLTPDHVCLPNILPLSSFFTFLKLSLLSIPVDLYLRAFIIIVLHYLYILLYSLAVWTGNLYATCVENASGPAIEQDQVWPRPFHRVFESHSPPKHGDPVDLNLPFIVCGSCVTDGMDHECSYPVEPKQAAGTDLTWHHPCCVCRSKRRACDRIVPGINMSLLLDLPLQSQWNEMKSLITDSHIVCGSCVERGQQHQCSYRPEDMPPRTYFPIPFEYFMHVHSLR